MDVDHQHRFNWIQAASTVELKARMVAVAELLANLHEDIAFMRCEEARDKTTDKTPRIDAEGRRDALIEEKFLIGRFM